MHNIWFKNLVSLILLKLNSWALRVLVVLFCVELFTTKDYNHFIVMLIYSQICRPYQNTHFPETARNLALRGHVPLQRDTCNKGLEAAPPELSASAECRPEVEYPILGSGKPGSSDYYQSNLSVWESFHANSFHCPSQKLEHESPRPQKSCATPLPELDDGAFPRHGPTSAPIASPTQNCRTFSNSDPER